MPSLSVLYLVLVISLPLTSNAQYLEWDRRFAVHGTRGLITAATLIDSGIVVGFNFSSVTVYESTVWLYGMVRNGKMLLRSLLRNVNRQLQGLLHKEVLR
jgi:hypothetical protein